MATDLRALLQRGQQQIADLQARQASDQQRLQGQLTAVKEQLTVNQRQLQQLLSTIQRQLPPVPPAAGDCPRNWIRTGSSCYLMSPTKATWLEAHQACAAFGPRARLVSIQWDSKSHILRMVSDSGGTIFGLDCSGSSVPGAEQMGRRLTTQIGRMGIGELSNIRGKGDCVTTRRHRQENGMIVTASINAHYPFLYQIVLSD